MEMAKLHHLLLIASWAFLFSWPQGSSIIRFGAAETYGNTYVVGGDGGWSFLDKTSGQPQDFGAWASKYTFFVNDVLVFNYDPNSEDVYSFDDVKDWQACNLTAGKLLDDGSSGSSQWYLPAEGYYDFASGLHCSEGQKFRIYAVNASNIQGSPSPSLSQIPPTPSPENPQWLPPPMSSPIPPFPPLPPLPALPPSEAQFSPSEPPSLIEAPPPLSPFLSSPWPAQEGAWAPVVPPSSPFSPNPLISDIPPPSISSNDSDVSVPALSPSSYVGPLAPAVSPSTLTDGGAPRVPYPRACYLLGAVLTIASFSLIYI